MPWDAGSADKTTKHAWLATLCVSVCACVRASVSVRMQVCVTTCQHIHVFSVGTLRLTACVTLHMLSVVCLCGKESKEFPEKDLWERKGGKRWRNQGGGRRLKTLDKRWPPSCCHSDTHSWNTPGMSPRKTSACHQHSKQSCADDAISSSPHPVISSVSSSSVHLVAPYLRAHLSDATDFLHRFLKLCHQFWLLTGSN